MTARQLQRDPHGWIGKLSDAERERTRWVPMMHGGLPAEIVNRIARLLIVDASHSSTVTTKETTVAAAEEEPDRELLLFRQKVKFTFFH